MCLHIGFDVNNCQPEKADQLRIGRDLNNDLCVIMATSLKPRLTSQDKDSQLRQIEYSTIELFFLAKKTVAVAFTCISISNIF